MKRRLVTLSLALLLGCGKVEKQQLLPWFQVKITHYPKFAMFPAHTTNPEYFVKSYGWWKKLDVYGFGAMALTSDTVVFYSNGQAQMIHKGDTTWQAICANPRSFATIVRGAPAIDCIEVLGGVLGFPTKIRFRRIDAAGHISDDRTLDVESPGRVFQGPIVKFYDDNTRPYFITIHDWPYTRPECAIVAADGQSIRGPVEMSVSDCMEAGFWSKVLQRRLH